MRNKISLSLILSKDLNLLNYQATLVIYQHNRLLEMIIV